MNFCKVGYNLQNLNKDYYYNILQLWDCREVVWEYSEDLSCERYNAIISNWTGDPLAYQDNRNNNEAVTIEFKNKEEFKDALLQLSEYINEPYSWSRYAEEGFEVTTKGGISGKRFTPFFMKYPGTSTSLHNASIEYKQSVDFNSSTYDSYTWYKNAYIHYFGCHPGLLYELLVIGIDHTFTDLHANNNNTQARAYAEICNLVVRFHAGKSLL